MPPKADLFALGHPRPLRDNNDFAAPVHRQTKVGGFRPRRRALCIRHFDRRIDPLPLRPLLLAIVAVAGLILLGVALSGLPRSFAAELPWVVPDWLQAHVGEG